ncbi:MAG: hypothetical protein ABWZ78_17275 [Burkholderiaceae bacterium]
MASVLPAASRAGAGLVVVSVVVVEIVVGVIVVVGTGLVATGVVGMVTVDRVAVEASSSATLASPAALVALTADRPGATAGPAIEIELALRRRPRADLGQSGRDPRIGRERFGREGFGRQ